MNERPAIDPRLVAAASERLHEEFLELGVDLLPRPVAAPPPTLATQSAAPVASPSLKPQATAPSLSQIADEIAACRACGLCQERTHTVPGEGDAAARLVFVGEAPGADEDASGRPFVGAAGQLLSKIITQGLGLTREQVFIANVLKCRPPGNRDPQPTEKSACTPFLMRQLELIQPQLVIALGKHAANHLLGTDQSLGSLRGRLHPHPAGFQVLATYHPAYLLRSPAAKADCWADLQLGMRAIGLPLPGQER